MMKTPLRRRVRAVRAVTMTKQGDAHVLFQPSHAYHYLRRVTPDFIALLAKLQAARALRRFVRVAETDNHQIVDVQDTPQTPFAIGPPLGWDGLEGSLDPTFDAVPALSVITPDKAKTLFRRMRTRGKVGGVGGDWISFAYPDDGCVERAHRMCELMLEEHGVTAGKVWVYSKASPLLVQTANHVECNVLWDYHVAPRVRVDVGGSLEAWVIDPSLGAGGPVRVKAWIDEVNGPTDDPTSRRFSSAGVYDQPLKGTKLWDRDFALTPEDLVYYQQDLIDRIEKFKKPPPYCED